MTERTAATHAKKLTSPGASALQLMACESNSRARMSPHALAALLRGLLPTCHEPIAREGLPSKQFGKGCDSAENRVFV